MYCDIWGCLFTLNISAGCQEFRERQEQEKQLLPRIIGSCVQKRMCNVPCYDNGLQAYEEYANTKERRVISAEEEMNSCSRLYQ